MYLDIGVYNFDKRISLLMKTLYVKPVANAVYILCYGNIFTGSRGGLSQGEPTSGLDNPPSNGGQNDGTHGVGAKNEWVNYSVWGE
jgi:hypothetical protein